MGTYKSFFCHSMNVGCVVGYYEAVGTLKPYHMLKNLFELIALKEDGGRKSMGISTCTPVRGLALAPTSHLVKLSLPNIHT